MTTPFDRRLLWVHWKGEAVHEATIAELALAIRQQTQEVAGIVVKVADGEAWQGEFDSKEAMAVDGPLALSRWVNELAQHDLETHLWSVIRGDDIPREAELLVQACSVPGVRSLLLDVEAGPEYFGGKTAQDARDLITRLRAGVDSAFHLGLNFDTRGSHPANIHIDEWLPHVQSLHPMVYHWHFSGGSEGPEGRLDSAFGRLAHYALPVVPMLQTYPEPSPVPTEHLTRAGNYAFSKGAFGATLFRYGKESSTSPVLAGVRGIDPSTPPGSLTGRRTFQVVTSSLRVRSAPSTSAQILARLSADTQVEVDPASRFEAEGFIWWQSAQGWLAQGRVNLRELYMLDVTPGVPPASLVTLPRPIPPDGEGSPEPPEDADPGGQRKRFRILVDRLNVRSAPDLRPESRTGVQLDSSDEIVVDADAWAEEEGFLWWNHGAGWSAERSLDEQRRFLEDLTPDVPRIDHDHPDGPGTPPEPGEPEPEIPRKRFRVETDRLNIRVEPGLGRSSATGTVLLTGEQITVPADAWQERDGFRWWQHTRGWSAERSLDDRFVFMEDLTPDIPRVEPPPPDPEEPPIDEDTRVFYVVRPELNIRSGPSLSGSIVGALAQGDRLIIDVSQPNVRVEAEGYVWWRHERGWSAERRTDNSIEWLLDINQLPFRRTLFQRLPVRLEEIGWLQYFGNTDFAFEHGAEHDYPSYSQGLHGGLDFGNSMANPPVFAGVDGIFLGPERFFGPNRVDIMVGDYTIVYGHLGHPAQISRGHPVTPDAVVGAIEDTRKHTHIEVRYLNRYIINPLLLMPQTLADAILGRFPPQPGTFKQTVNWTQWQTPLDQPIILRGGPVVGPTA